MKKKFQWIDAVYIGVSFLALYFAMLNIAPYGIAISKLSLPLQDQVLNYLLDIFPFLSVVGGALIWLLGACLWALIQLIECLPLLIKEDAQFLATLIQLSQGKKYQTSDDEDPLLRRLKLVYNRLPISLIKNIYFAQIATYTIDFLVCLSVYPPAASGGEFLNALITGDFTAINWPNLFLAGVTLFSVEVLLYIMIYTGRLRLIYKLSRQ